ncbi:hypothetical protein EVAR_64646_1 [Eumeta japonica]|uniref:Uncharacterized protein n=1 Tax=Eumeta variegata TaxID=151549 RepID=A0A4C1ZF94_EUMVA|nr:hypothetical protein EVAR_64646_1 [Eumeta japonica]
MPSPIRVVLDTNQTSVLKHVKCCLYNMYLDVKLAKVHQRQVAGVGVAAGAGYHVALAPAQKPAGPARGAATEYSPGSNTEKLNENEAEIEAAIEIESNLG